MEQKSNGTMISAIIIIIVLVIGAFFFWKHSVKNKGMETPPPAYNSPAASAEATDISAVENDLNSMDVDGLDEGL